MALSRLFALALPITRRIRANQLYAWIMAISAFVEQPTIGLQQAAWVIDPVNGSDANPGTALLPIKTNAELARRWGRQTLLTQPTTITWVSAPPTTDVLMLDIMTTGVGSLIGAGTPVVQPVLGSGAFTAVQTVNRAGNLVTNVTDGARAWTINQRIRIVTSADPTHVGAVAWVQKDLGAGAAETSCFLTYTVGTNPAAGPTQITTGGNLGPAVGDTYVVETMPIIPVGFVRWNATGPSSTTNCQCFWDRIEFDGSGGSLEGQFNSDTSAGPVFTSCILKALTFTGATGSSVACWGCEQDSCVIAGTRVLFAGGGNCGVANVMLVNNGGQMIVDKEFLGSDVGICTCAHAGSSLVVGTAAAMRAATVITLFSGASARQFNQRAGANALYGSANGTGLAVKSNANYQYVTKPTIATTVTDTVIGGVNTAWAAVPAVTAANNASVVLFA